MSYTVTVCNNKQNSLFVEVYPGMNLFFKLINFLFSDFKLEASLHDIHKVAKMLVVFFVCKLMLEQKRCKVHKPKTPTLCGKIASIHCNVREAPKKGRWNVLDCIHSLMSNFCPHLLCDLIISSTNIQALEFSHPQLY